MRAAPDVDEPCALHCDRCGAEVGRTQHTRAGYAVGYYLLHTGRTEEATVRRGEDETRTYRRVVVAFDVVACPGCLATPELQQRWRAFGEEG